VIPSRQSAATAPAAAPAEENPSTTSEEARSSCPPGTVLNGLNYFKGKTDPVALPDSEYPEWLWSCLDVTKGSAAEEDADAGDEFCMLPHHLPPHSPRFDTATSKIIMLISNSPKQRSPRSSAG
jgi:hypothetical protein